MSWRTVYISQCEKLSLHLDSLLLIKDSKEHKIPLKDIGSIIIEDYKTIFTVKILNKLVEYNILLIICDEKYNPYSILTSVGNNSRQYKIVSKQIKWKEKEKDILWKDIIKIKLTNQHRVLELLKSDEEYLENIKRYIDEVEVGDKTNREGIGAGVYFRGVFGNDFRRKVGGGVKNSALNYGYTILTSKMSRIISGKGLLTYVGIHHKNEYNQFNLSCDLVEVFRPIVDLYVAKYLKEVSYFAREDRLELINLLNIKILYCGRKEYLEKCMEKYVDYVIEYFETGEIIEGRIPTIEGLEFYEL